MGRMSSLSEGDRYVAVHDSARFTTLRRRQRTFTLWAGAVFTGWWFLASLLGAFAPGFYRQMIAGDLSVGLLVVLATFVLVLVIAAGYLRYARATLDPLAEQIRADLEGAPR
ncbi:hypothetical protein GCM10022419_112450 [Nonomuraea rosea]|uniref:DUF485 domain-containing protein n=1 Tax=Nonomuraea rosea TaxID=638574 RepID=A0ABP6ZHK2_9ACTN